MGTPLLRSPLLPALLALAVYSNSLGGSFVFDDTYTIVREQELFAVVGGGERGE